MSPLEPAAGPAPERSGARRALAILLPAVGLALLAVVLWKVPWSDRVHRKDGTVLLGEVLSEGERQVVVRAAGEPAPRTILREDLAVRDGGLPAVEPGVRSLLRRFTPGPVVAVLLVIGGTILLAAFRWRLLLRAGGLPVGVREAGSLTLMGNFFNQVVPGGIVGGDLLKAVYAARGRERDAAAHAAVSVFVDRYLGLFGMLLLAAGALLPRWSDERFRRHEVLILGLLAAGIAAGVVVLSRRARSLLRMESWVPRIPVAGRFLAEADLAVLSFRRHRGAVAAGVAMSVAIHAGWCGANALLGAMVGLDLAPAEYFAVIPPILVVSSIPLLPGGWGLGEVAYVVFLGLLGVPPAEAVAVSVLGRVSNMVWALPGGIVFLSRRD